MKTKKEKQFNFQDELLKQIPDQHKLKEIENGIHQKSEKVNEMTNLMDQKMSQLNLLMKSFIVNLKI